MCDDCKKPPRPGSDCWPGDKDYLDGSTEIFLPSEKYLKAYWDCDIIDNDKNPQDTIIESKEAFQVRFRVELKGRLNELYLQALESLGEICLSLGDSASAQKFAQLTLAKHPCCDGARP